MSRAAIRQRPPSPPYSSDGDLGLVSNTNMPFDAYTPPGPLRAPSSEPSQKSHGIPTSHHTDPDLAYASPQKTFVRHINRRPTPIGARPIVARRGSALKRPSATTVLAKPSPPKKRKTAQGRYQIHGNLSGPLSEVTKAYTIPVKDMEAWVNRSVEERLREVKKKNGHIARPMNSFMLYRSAYADRVKQYCKENNHQIVSKVTGQSWPMEPQEIRTQYERYANMERDNHQAAHPGYKFTPNKKGRKRVRSDVDDSDGEGDSDGEWGGSRSTKRSRVIEREISRSLSSTPFDNTVIREEIQYLPEEQQPSPYHAMMPRRPILYHFDPVALNGGYYEPQMISYGPNVGHGRFESVQAFSPLYEPEAGLTGMPEGSEHLIGALGHPSTEAFETEIHIDPRLGAPSTHYSYGHHAISDEVYVTPRSIPFETYPPPPAVTYSQSSVHPGMMTLSASNEWHYRGALGDDLDEGFDAY